MKTYYVYVMSNVSKMLYVGLTNDLKYRVAQHKKKLIPGFAARHNLFKLVYVEEYQGIREAIRREKQLKGWLRRKKVELIRQKNPEWLHLAAAWSMSVCKEAVSSRGRRSFSGQKDLNLVDDSTHR